MKLLINSVNSSELLKININLVFFVCINTYEQ